MNTQTVWPTSVLCWALAALLAPTAVAAQQTKHASDPILYSGLEWRNIGPFRGGRSVAVAGVPTQSHTYYFGATGGGVWKTDDAGITWRNVSDKFFRSGSVGAVAVAESDPNVVYVGMGEHAIRGVATSHGNGVYRSDDAGHTWKHLGLERTRHISAVRVHPQNPELVYVAAQGAAFGPNPERGIFRSRDGGKSWQRVLHVSADAGASDLSMDMTNPRVLYAAFWDHRRLPWQVRSGGPGSAIYRSADGGDTWTKLTNGLPPVMGKIGVAVSRANPNRVWAIIEADEGGVFRSDDRGESWTRINKERLLRARAWYYTKVFADPQDAERVYVLNAPMLKSTDGGRTFTSVAVPHGDNHGLWINPLNNQYLINSNDGGANVSLNGGRSWSTQQNQPTAQFYRVITDNRFPYWVYGGQQDNSSVAIASRTMDAGIDWKDWHAVSGCESAYLAFNPEDPTLVYGGCYQGQIEEWDARTDLTRAIMAYPYQGLASRPSEVKYRFNWNAPILVSRHNPHVIYHAGNVLLKSEDRGQTWTEISPDLTRNERAKQGPGGSPITNEGAGGEVYNTIFYVAESPHAAGTLWVGSDDGLVHLTRNGGRTWSKVTPPGIGETQINSIEVSPHDPATAYVVATRYKFNDFTPHILRTTNFGRSWTRMVNGIRPDDWVRVVREDPVRRELLYAGTETGFYVSWDGGTRWQPMQLNLPVVPVTDLQIQRRDNDLVASTQGRSFWILDDLTPLQQMDPAIAARDVHLFRPERAYRMGGGSGPEGAGREAGMGRNPSNGVILYYWVKKAPTGTATLEILDPQGQVIRTFSSARPDTVRTLNGPWAPRQLPTKAGMNRIVWDLRSEDMTRVAGIFIHGALAGPRVPPGRYLARLVVNGRAFTQPIEVAPDPRSQLAEADYRDQKQLAEQIRSAVNELHGSVIQMRSVREQVKALVERTRGHSAAPQIAAAGNALVKRIDQWEEILVSPEQQTFQDVINFPNRLNAELLYLGEVVGGQEPPVTGGARQRWEDLRAEWQRQQAARDRLLQEVAAFNTLFRENTVPAVVVPPARAAGRL